jgi:hypothetical protein
MTALQLYALLSPVVALVVMSAFAAVLMRQTNRDIARLAEASVTREIPDIVAERNAAERRDKASSQERTLA